MQALDELIADVADVRGARAGAPGADRRLRRATSTSTRARCCSAEGEPADRFFLIRTGAVALEVARARPRRARDRDAASSGEVVGWSWLFEPYRWQLDARALEPMRADRLRRRLPARQVRRRTTSSATS